MSSPERAINEGKNLLDRFRSVQGEEGPDDSSSSYSQPEFEKPRDKAIAEGSLLAQSYSATKRGGRAPSDAASDVVSDDNGGLEFSDWGANQTPHKAHEAADIIGKIMNELGSIERHGEPALEQAGLSERLGKISDMLYSVKTQLVHCTSNESKQNKLDFSPYSNGNDEENSMVKTPGKNDILKNYMRNQLELQESEWESYEEAINSLAEQLELKGKELEDREEAVQRLTDERDDLVCMTTSLGERLQGLGQEKYQLLMEREEWQVEKQELSERLTVFEGNLTVKDEQLQQTMQRLTELEEETNGLRDQCRASERSVQDGRRKIEGLTTENIDLQKRLVAMNADKKDLEVQLEEWEKFEKSNSAEIDALHTELRDVESKYRLELQEATERCSALSQQVFESETASATTIADLRAQLKQLSLQSEDDRAAMDSFRDQILRMESSDQAGVKDLAEALDATQQYRAQLNELTAVLATRDDAIAQLKEVLNSSDLHAKNLEARVEAAEAAARQLQELRDMEGSLNSPPHKSQTEMKDSSAKKSPGEAGTSVLKNYMKNQLELQEAEWENYEETINNLASQLEESRQQVKAREGEMEQLSAERDELQARLLQVGTSVGTPGLRPAPVNVDISGEKQSNQPSSVRSFISLDSSVGDAGSPHKYSSYQFDYSVFDDTDMAEQIEQFKAHVEQQIRVQVSQLQSLQESLSEEKNTTALLQKQKYTLKSMIGNLNTEIDELKGRIGQYEEAEMTLRNQISDLRAVIAEKEEQIAHAAKVPLASATPASAEKKQNSDYPRTPEVFDYRGTIANLEANLSLKTTRCDELTVEIGKLRTAVTAKIDELGYHKAQFIKAEAELQATLMEKEKTISMMQDLISRLESQAKHDANNIEELNALVLSERDENHALNDVLNMIKEKDDATESMLQGMSEQRMVMSTRFVEIESRVTTLTTQLRESETRYESTVQLLKEAERERDSNNTRIVEYKSKFADLDQSTFDKLSESETTITRLQRQLVDEKDEIVRLQKRLSSANDLAEGFAKTASEEKSRVVATQLRVDELTETVQSLKNHIERLKREAEADRREIESLLVAADDRTVAGDESRKKLLAQLSEKDMEIAERDSNIKMLHHQAAVRCDEMTDMEGQIRVLKKNITAGVNDCNAMTSAFKAMATEVSYFDVSSCEQSEALMSRVSGWVTLFGNRLDTVCDQVSFLTEDYKDREALMADLKEQLADSRGYGERLEFDRLELEERLAEQMDTVNVERERFQVVAEENASLRNQLAEAERRVYQERALVDQSKQSFSGDIHRLAERLESAEKRAQETAAANAKLFANGARGTAFLEGECSRLRGLVDHLRLVNAKLQGDVKAANALAAHGRGFENRLKISVGEVDRLKIRVGELEEELNNKDSHHLTALQELQDTELMRQRQQDEEMEQLVSDIAMLKSELGDTKSELENTVVTKESMQSSLRSQIEELSREMQRSDENVAYLEGNNVEMESRLNSLKMELQAAEEFADRLRQDHTAEILSLSDQINEKSQLVSSLEKELNNSGNRLKSVETDCDILNAKLKASTDELSERDDSISRLMSKYEATKDELDLLRSKVSASESELDNMINVKAKDSELLTSLKDEKDGLRNRVSDLENEIHRVTTALTASNNKIKGLAGELDEKDRSIFSLEDELAKANRSLYDAESRIEDLVQDVSEFRERAQALELDIAEQQADLSSLTGELEAVSKESSQKAKENSLLSSRLEDTQASISALSEKLSLSETAQRDATSLLMQLGAAERGIVVTMNSFIAANNAAEEKKDHEQKKLGKKPTDLFEEMLASPPPPTTLIYATPTGEKIPIADKPDGSRLTFDVESVPYTLDGEHFYGLQASVNALQDFISHYRSRCSGLEAALGAASSRSHDFEVEFKALHAKYSETKSELSRVSSESVVMEEELEELTKIERTRQNDCDLLRQSNNALSAQLRSVKRDIQNLLHAESTSRAQGIVESHGAEPVPLLLRGGIDSKQSAVNDSDLVPYGDDGNSVLLSDLRNTLTSFSKMLEKLSQDLNNRDRELRHLESKANENATSWGKERDALNSRLQLAVEASEEEELVNKECRHLLQKVSDELERSKSESDRKSKMINDLEGNLRSRSAEIDDLRKALECAERTHAEVSEELRNERQGSTDAMNMLDKSQRDIQNLRQKVSSLNLIIEEKSSENDRLMSSNHSANEVRQALELELEQTRADLEQLSVQDRNAARAEDSKAAYEVERLLAALAATVDHMHSASQTNISFDQSLDVSVHSHSSFTGGVISGQNLVTRVDQAVKRLSEMRSWAREEKRATKKLVTTNSDLERELAALKSSSAQRIKSLTEDVERARSREQSHQNNMTVLSEKDSTILRLQTDLSALQQEVGVYRSTKNSDGELRSAQTAELLKKDSEISRLSRELQSCTAEYEMASVKIAATEKDITSLRSDKSDMENQIKLIKSNNAKLQDTVDRLEISTDRYKQEIELLQKRLLAVSSSSGSGVETMRIKLAELESALQSAKDSHESYKRTAEERYASVAGENEEYRRRVGQLEIKLETHFQARTSSSEEVAALRHELHKAKTQREMESSDWNSSRAKFSTMKSSEDEWKMQLDAASSMLESMEDRLNVSESECSRLRSQLQSYQDSQNSDYRAQLTIEIDARKRLEVEAGRISAALERCQRESAATSSKASALRAEGRHVRRCVLEISQQMEELVGEMRRQPHGDRAAGPLNDSNSSGHASGSLLAAALGLRAKGSVSEGAELIQTVDGTAVEGVHELTNALETIRKTISWMKSITTWNGNHDVEGKLRRVEAENARLIREADNFATMQEDKCQRLQAEIETLENLLSVSRHRESSRINELDSRKSEIENSTARDKETLKKIENDLRRSLDRVADLESEKSALQGEITRLNMSSKQVEESNILRKQLQACKTELQLLRKKNDSLRDTLSSLEALSHRDTHELSMSSEYPTGMSNISYLSSTLGSGEFLKAIDPQQSAQIHEGILQLQRHLSKYRLRAKMFEDICNVFRGAYLTAISLPVAHEAGQPNAAPLAIAPYGRVVEVVRKSYEESMNLLEEQVESCLGVIRQNNSYMTELRTRLEDTLRALYKNGRGEATSSGSVESSQLQHIELLSKSLKQAQDRYETCSTALAEERRSGRHRHEAIVSELSSVVTTCEQAQQETERWRDESETLQQRLDGSNSEINNLKRTVDSLRHGLIETDMELDTVQRLQRRHEQLGVKPDKGGDMFRSVSQGHSRAGNHATTGIERHQTRSIHEGLHESTPFSLKEMSRDHEDIYAGVGNYSTSTSRGDLSDAVQSALGAAAQLRSEQRHKSAVVKTGLDGVPAQGSSMASRHGGYRDDNFLSSSQYSIRVRSRDESTGGRHMTPPRDKRPAVSNITPTSISRTGMSRTSETAGHEFNRSMSSPHAHSLNRGSGGISSYSSARESSMGSSSEVLNSTHTFRRKVKATVRRNN